MGRGGLLLLSGRDAPEIRRPEALAGALLRECGRRDYGGVVLDFEGPPSQDRRSFAAVLGRQCAAAGRTLYLPEAYAGAALPCRVIVNTAVSGGSLEEHLRECCRAYGGAQNIALDLQRLRMGFPPPADRGNLCLRRRWKHGCRSGSLPSFTPEICASGTLPARITAQLASSSLTMQEPCGRSCGWAGRWGFPPRFSSGRRSGTSLPDCFIGDRKHSPEAGRPDDTGCAEPGTSGADRKNRGCCTAPPVFRMRNQSSRKTMLPGSADSMMARDFRLTPAARRRSPPP